MSSQNHAFKLGSDWVAWSCTWLDSRALHKSVPEIVGGPGHLGGSSTQHSVCLVCTKLDHYDGLYAEGKENWPFDSQLSSHRINEQATGALGTVRCTILLGTVD